MGCLLSCLACKEDTQSIHVSFAYGTAGLMMMIKVHFPPQVELQPGLFNVVKQPLVDSKKVLLRPTS